MAMEPSSGPRTDASEPPMEPMGVRDAPTITTSCGQPRKQ